MHNVTRHVPVILYSLESTLCTGQEYVHGKIKNILMHLSSGQVTLFLVQLLTLLFLWESWKELKEQVCYIACPEKCAEELCPKCYLSHRQNNLSWTSGHHVFCTLYFLA